MLFPLLLAGSIALIAVALVIYVQALFARSEERALKRKRAIVELASRRGGVVTPLLVAGELGITALEADRLLRSMLDDVHLTMHIDEREGELRFTFTKVVEAAHSKAPTQPHSGSPRTT